MFDVCVWGYVFPTINATCYQEAKDIACNMYTKITGISIDISDAHIVWKRSFEYPYKWK